MEKLNEKEIYNKIKELKKGSEKDIQLAFRCIGILGNESSNESLEGKLQIVNDLIENHNKKNK